MNSDDVKYRNPKKRIRPAKSVEEVHRSAKWHVFESRMAFFLTEAELRLKLSRKTDVAEWIDAAVLSLKNYNYIQNDEDFAYRFIEQCYFGDYAGGRIYQVLEKKLIPKKVITQQIQKFRDEHQIDELAILTKYLQSYYCSLSILPRKSCILSLQNVDLSMVILSEP